MTLPLVYSHATRCKYHHPVVVGLILDVFESTITLTDLPPKSEIGLIADKAGIECLLTLPSIQFPDSPQAKWPPRRFLYELATI